ncbi:ABC transporter ATP-binding protein [Williamsoniiplasma luminosum]|uniref:ABC transporter ATP-binding protein n=1 Tax=Williamsoniiplasma luminosum TaxID=214888 RepID=A0A2K8NW41_9MOLU|nr:ABC transporter ATP-binding protein [Williamsoniiplasma luminosum]ATZ17418.1 ABC transporter ATP-binding protein [Williamsoniiplasma luminosum]AVP49229.1 MAG: ABC transporter ATP-binding protein [Williamsoniiplasma luminosum]
MKEKQKKKLPNPMKFESEFAFSWQKMGAFAAIIWETAKKNPLLFISMVLTTSLNAVIATTMPLISSKAVTLLTANGRPLGPEFTSFLGMDMVWTSWIWVAVFMFVILLISEYITDYTIGLFSLKIEINERIKIVQALVKQDVDFYFDHVSGNILTRFVADTQNLSQGIQQFLSNLIYCLVAFIAATIILFSQNLYLVGGVTIGYVVFVLVIAVFIFVYFRRALIRQFDFKREVDADITDRINNITLIKSTGTENYEIDRLYQKNQEYSRKGDRGVLLSTILTLWLTVTISFLTTLITIVVIVGVIKGGHDGPSLMFELTTGLPMASSMAMAIYMLVPSLRAATRASNASHRINELTKPIPFIQPNPEGPKINKISSIEFKNIDFAYPKKIDKVIIPNLSFKFEKGKSYAFVGETGSGKSTIGRLLLRYYDPKNGQIIINNKHDLKDVNLPSYLDNIGYVEQDPQIFYGNFIDNIKYGRFSDTKEQVMEAAKKADLHDFIMSLPEGYETLIGQRGFLLSGGQKQRLIIARVFLRDPDLVILDEATSALDNIVEKEIQDQLDKLVVGKTSITIAHRLSTIKNVDQIIVLGMNKGIVQVGTFEELINKPGHFKNLYEAGTI